MELIHDMQWNWAWIRGENSTVLQFSGQRTKNTVYSDNKFWNFIQLWFFISMIIILWRSGEGIIFSRLTQPFLLADVLLLCISIVALLHNESFSFSSSEIMFWNALEVMFFGGSCARFGPSARWFHVVLQNGFTSKKLTLKVMTS